VTAHGIERQIELPVRQSGRQSGRRDLQLVDQPVGHSGDTRC